MMKTDLTDIIIFLAIITISGFGCNKSASDASCGVPVDLHSTQSVVNLYSNLIKYSDTIILYGHQDDNITGVNWSMQTGRSDIRESSGAYPGVFGFDITQGNADKNINGISFSYISKSIKSAYDCGALITVNWKPADSSSFEEYLPGGVKNDIYVEQLKKAADFISELKTDKGDLIPVIFRPLNCMNIDFSLREKYSTLWKYTVKQMRDVFEVHNILYVFCPQGKIWPGDEYVDIVGLEFYFHGSDTMQYARDLALQLDTLVQCAKAKKKPAVLAETGLKNLSMATWHTNTLLPALEQYGNRYISYFLIWRNSSEDNFYAPYSGHKSTSDLRTFTRVTRIKFSDSLPDMYGPVKENNTKQSKINEGTDL